MSKKLLNKALALITHAELPLAFYAAASTAEWRSIGLLAMGAARKDKNLSLHLLSLWQQHLLDNQVGRVFISPFDGVYLGSTAGLMRQKPEFKPLLEAIFPFVFNHHIALFQEDNPAGEGLITLQGPINLTAVYAGYWARKNNQLVQAPGYQSALLWSVEFLIDLGRKLKVDTLDLVLDNELAVHAINNQLWDETKGSYGAFLPEQQEVVFPKNLAAFSPLASGAPTQEQAELILLQLEKLPWKSAPHGLLQTDFSEDDQADLFLNWMIIKGLLRYDMYALAARLRRDLLFTIEQEGIFEKYHATSGKGSDGANSPYAAAIIIDLLYAI